MNATFGIMRYGTRLLVLALAVVSVSPAQMCGMMGCGNGGYGNSGYGSLGGMMTGSLTGMMGGASGLTIGSDGTLYITRSAPAQGQGQGQGQAATQLAAIDGNGNVKWTVPINASSASQPALGKDGTLFVTTSDWWNGMYSWMYSFMYNWGYGGNSAPAAGTTPNLLIVKPGATSAGSVVTVPLVGQVASVPQIATDNAGGYVVYVVTVNMFNSGAYSPNATTAGSYLYAFSPTGQLKYQLQLSQGGSGVTGFGCW